MVDFAQVAMCPTQGARLQADLPIRLAFFHVVDVCNAHAAKVGHCRLLHVRLLGLCYLIMLVHSPISFAWRHLDITVTIFFWPCVSLRICFPPGPCGHVADVRGFKCVYSDLHVRMRLSLFASESSKQDFEVRGKGLVGHKSSLVQSLAGVVQCCVAREQQAQLSPEFLSSVSLGLDRDPISARRVFRR